MAMVDLGLAELLFFIVWIVLIWSWSAKDEQSYQAIRFFSAAMGCCFIVAGFVMWLFSPSGTGQAPPADSAEFLLIGAGLLAALFTL